MGQEAKASPSASAGGSLSAPGPWQASPSVGTSRVVCEKRRARRAAGLTYVSSLRVRRRGNPIGEQDDRSEAPADGR
jgi:hypothetical protein